MLFRNFQKTIDAILFGNNKKIPAIHQFCFSNGTELVSAAAYGAAAGQAGRLPARAEQRHCQRTEKERTVN